MSMRHDKIMTDRPLFCIVASREQASLAKPDLGKYTPKELAAKEGVSPIAVYAWLREGLPAMRQGSRGHIQIYYQDYVHWMIECARLPDCKVKSIPVWAFWFVRSENWKSPIPRR